jgi:bacterial/archaeal transporter family protein
MSDSRWMIYALLSAACAALVGVLGRVGLKNLEPNLATAARSVVMSVLLLGFLTLTRGWAKLPPLNSRPSLMILLSAAAGAASWLFYFNALRLAEVSRVAPVDKLSTPIAVILAVVFLGERPTLLNWLGVALMVGGAYLVSLRPAA